MLDHIKESSKNSKRKLNTLFGRDVVHIIDPLPEHVSVDNVLKRIESTRITGDLVRNIDAIYIGEFDLLVSRDISALYYHDTIYITNDQENENDIFDDLVHEIAHAIESDKKEYIYGDMALEKEFMKKRRQVFDVLVELKFDVEWEQMSSPDYEKKLDYFLHKVVGYDMLGHVINGIFVSPYSVTSIREYWAKGFEHYLLGKSYDLKEVCPILYNKVDQLFEQGEF